MSRAASQHPPKRSRADWYADAKRLRDQGMSGLAVARELGLSSAFVYGLLGDPDGSKDRERKKRYRGTCIDCGGPTQGGDGLTKAPERCQPCRNRYERTVLKYWTRDRVIAAIQRFAREHGRPPHANDWQHAGRGEGYPPATAVYRSAGMGSAPFAQWADAIEAAGFPRPQVGVYHRDERWRAEFSKRSRIWSDAMIIAALQGWAERHGRRPMYEDWRVGGKGRPTAKTVVDRFGGWRVALRKAGLL